MISIVPQNTFKKQNNVVRKLKFKIFLKLGKKNLIVLLLYYLAFFLW